MMRSYILVMYWMLCYAVIGVSQSTFMEMHSAWDDQYSQWEIVVIDTNDQENVITIDQVWPLNSNFEEWRITSDNLNGRLKTKWKGDLTKWELNIDGRLLSIDQKWRNDPNQWEVRSGSKRVLIKTEYRNNANVWIARLKEGDFVMYTDYRDDPRDWIIEDYIIETLSDEEKLAMVFISMFQSIEVN